MIVNTISKHLLFNTVKITCVMPGGVVSHGTGFIIDILDSPEQNALIVITNRHVVEGALHISIRMIGRMKDADQPLLGTAHDFSIDNNSVQLVGHPDPTVDIAAFPLLPVIGAMEPDVFFRFVARHQIATPVQAAAHDALEEVTFVGYPNGWSDELHHTPIVRRGITATPMGLKFGGKPVFLVDGSVFGGSSGSPVFLFNEGTYSDGQGNLVVGTRFQLVGIMAATLVRHSNLPMTVATQPHVKLAQEMNLGVAYNSHAIVETIAEFERVHGIKATEPTQVQAVQE